MVGAEEWATFLKAKEILTDMGKIVYHCGAVGTGQVQHNNAKSLIGTY